MTELDTKWPINEESFEEMSIWSDRPFASEIKPKETSPPKTLPQTYNEKDVDMGFDLPMREDFTED